MAAIELEGLTKDYGSVLATDDLTFSVSSGEIFGYLGPNGAGKTTTIRMVLGFVSPTSGRATVLGTDVRDRTALVETRRRIGYLSDEPGFDGTDTGADVLALHADVKGDERSEELLAQFDPPLERPIRDYSRGNVQKLGIVTTFMHDPDLVVLDEPTTGLDPLMKQRFAEFLRTERERGVTVFFSSHVLSEVRRLCDRVGIVRDGRLVTVEPVAALLERNGKVIRIHSNEPIPRSVLDLSGVHDLETESRPASARASADTADTADTADAAGTETFTDCAFTFTGNLQVLLRRVIEYDVVDLSIEEAPLEDVFMRFYGATDGGERTTDGRTKATDGRTEATDGRPKTTDRRPDGGE